VGEVTAAAVVTSTCVTVCSDESTATEPSVPVAEALTLGASGAAMLAETSTDASEASVEGAEISTTVVTTGVTTCSVGVVVGCSTVAVAGAGSLEEIGSDVELRNRRPV